MVVCGFCALFTPLAVQDNTLKKDFPFSIIIAGVLLVLGFFGMSLGRVDGIILLVIFVIFILMMIKSAKNARNSDVIIESEEGLPYRIDYGGVDRTCDRKLLILLR